MTFIASVTCLERIHLNRYDNNSLTHTNSSVGEVYTFFLCLSFSKWNLSDKTAKSTKTNRRVDLQNHS